MLGFKDPDLALKDILIDVTPAAVDFWRLHGTIADDRLSLIELRFVRLLHSGGMQGPQAQTHVNALVGLGVGKRLRM